jgi:tryptophan synthase alpha chain
MARIVSGARGFVYAVGVTGTTGERSGLAPELADMLTRAKAHASVPVAVGFGIGDPAQAAAAAAAGAEGVIVGSRLVRAAGEDPNPVEAVGALVRAFADALH